MMHSSPAPSGQLPTSPMPNSRSKPPSTNNRTPTSGGIAPNDPRLASYRQSPSADSNSATGTSNMGASPSIQSRTSTPTTTMSQPARHHQASAHRYSQSYNGANSGSSSTSNEGNPRISSTGPSSSSDKRMAHPSFYPGQSPLAPPLPPQKANSTTHTGGGSHQAQRQQSNGKQSQQQRPAPTAAAAATLNNTPPHSPSSPPPSPQLLQSQTSKSLSSHTTTTTTTTSNSIQMQQQQQQPKPQQPQSQQAKSHIQQLPSGKTFQIKRRPPVGSTIDPTEPFLACDLKAAGINSLLFSSLNKPSNKSPAEPPLSTSQPASAANQNVAKQPTPQQPPKQVMKVKHRPKKNTERYNDNEADSNGKSPSSTSSNQLVESSPPAPAPIPTPAAAAAAAAPVPAAIPEKASPQQQTTKLVVNAQPVGANSLRKSSPTPPTTPVVMNRSPIILDRLPDVTDVSKSMVPQQMSPRKKYGDTILSAVGLQPTSKLPRQSIITSSTNSENNKSVSEQSNNRTKQPTSLSNNNTNQATPAKRPPSSPAPTVGASRSTPNNNNIIKKTPNSRPSSSKVQGWCYVSHRGDEPFNWDIYLKVKPAPVAPKDAFNQNMRPLENKFLAGMKLEAKDPRSSGWALATVIWSLGLRIRLRFDGGDHMNDFFEVIDSENIRPVGSDPCEILCAPVGFKQNLAKYPNFVEKTLTAADVTIAAPEFFHRKPKPPQSNLFRKGMKLEAVDRKNAYLICPATVSDVKAQEIHVQFDGWQGTFGYTCRFDSRDLFPINWCRDTNYPITPPHEWDIILQSSLNQSPEHAQTQADNISDIRPDQTPKSSKTKDRKRTKTTTPEQQAADQPLKKLAYSPESARPGRLNVLPTARRSGPPPTHRITDSTKVEVATKPVKESVPSPGEIVAATLPREEIATEPIEKVMAQPEKVVVSQPEKVVVSQPEKVVVSQPEKVVVSQPEKVVVAQPEKVVVSQPEVMVAVQPEVMVVEQQPKKQQESSSNASKPYTEMTVTDILDLIRRDDGLSKYSQVFEDHEIDGNAFVLLSTDIMINHMGLKIGPVMKINALIEKLKRSV